MDAGKSRTRELRFLRQLTYGKKTGSTDYTIIGVSGEELDRATADLFVSVASKWNTACLSSNAKEILACEICHDAGRVLSVWARTDSSRDSFGRAAATAFVGELAMEPNPVEVRSLLLALWDKCESGEKPETLTIEISPHDQPVKVTFPILLTIALKDCVVHISDSRMVDAVLNTVTLQNIDWVAMSSSPLNSPPSGRGIIQAANRWSPPPDIADLCNRKSVMLDNLPLYEAFKQCGTDYRKAILLLLDEDVSQDALNSFSWKTRHFLAQHPGTRESVFNSLPDGQVTCWVNSEILAVNDLPKLIGRVGVNEREAIIALLKRNGIPELELYYRLFQGDINGLLALLPDSDRRIWSALLDPTDRPNPNEAAHLWNLLTNTSWPTCLEEAQLAGFVRCGVTAACPLLCEWLCKHGLKREFAEVLVAGTRRFNENWTVPDIPLRISWVQAAKPTVAFTILKSASPEWSSWATSVVEHLWNLKIVSAADVLPHAVEIRSEPLLRRCQVPPSLLELACGEDVVTLPPDENWPKCSAVLLTKLIDSDSGEFFNRIHPASVDGLLNWLMSFDDRELCSKVEIVAETLAREDVLNYRWARFFAPLLDRLPLIRHLVRFSQLNEKKKGDRHELLERLLASSRLTESESDWLNALLLGCDILPETPTAWSALEMCELLPLLNIERDVIRIVMQWSTCDPNEPELLAAVVESLHHDGHGILGPPSETAASRRPEWFRDLNKIYGWSSL